MGARVEPSGGAAFPEIEGLTSARLEAIAAIWKREARQLTARFGGSSMEPTIPSGGEVVLRCGGSPEPGDIAAFIDRGRILVHRVVARSPSRGWLLTRGDASAIPDPPIREAATIGTVVRVRLGDLWVEPPPPPATVLRCLALALCLVGFRAPAPVARRLIGLLWILRRWFVLAPRALARSARRWLAPRNG